MLASDLMTIPNYITKL